MLPPMYQNLVLFKDETAIGKGFTEQPIEDVEQFGDGSVSKILVDGKWLSVGIDFEYSDVYLSGIKYHLECCTSDLENAKSTIESLYGYEDEYLSEGFDGSDESIFKIAIQQTLYEHKAHHILEQTDRQRERENERMQMAMIKILSNQ